MTMEYSVGRRGFEIEIELRANEKRRRDPELILILGQSVNRKFTILKAFSVSSSGF